MTIRKRGKKFYYDFTLPGYPRMRGLIAEARTKWEAEQAEIKLKREIFENRYDIHQDGDGEAIRFHRQCVSALVKAQQAILAR